MEIEANGLSNALRRTEAVMLGPATSIEDIKALCERAIDSEVAAVQVPGSFLEIASDLLEETSIDRVATVAFPLGHSDSDCKRFETESHVDLGATIIDVAMNLGLLRSGRTDLLHREIRDVIEAAGILPVRVVVEIPLMNEHEIVEACGIAADAGAHAIRAGTGFYGSATIDHIEFLNRAVDERVAILAAGQYNDPSQVEALLEAGAERVCTPFATDISENHPM